MSRFWDNVLYWVRYWDLDRKGEAVVAIFAFGVFGWLVIDSIRWWLS